MPKHSGLLRRGNRYYLNFRVPKALRPLYGKSEFVRKSLGTSDPREAISLVRYEAFKLESEFKAKRREMETAEPPSTLRTLGDKEAHEMVFRWFIEQEKLSEEWWVATGCKMDEVDAESVLDNLRTDEVVYSGGSRHYRAEDAGGDLDAFLKSSGLECPKDSPAYQKLLSLFTKGRLENVHRNMARVSHQTVTAREPLFHDLFAHTEPPARQSITVGEMVERFVKCLPEHPRAESPAIPLRQKGIHPKITRDFRPS
jgi:hypothetical protein